MLPMAYSSSFIPGISDIQEKATDNLLKEADKYLSLDLRDKSFHAM